MGPLMKMYPFRWSPAMAMRPCIPSVSQSHELATKKKKKWKAQWDAWTGTWQCSRSTSKTPVAALSWTDRSQGKWPCRHTGGQRSRHKRLVCKAEDLKYLGAWDTNCRHKVIEHHPIDRLEERGVERGSARWSSSKGRERAIVSQSNARNISKAPLGKRLRRVGAHTSFDECVRTTLNLNWSQREEP